jgi:hypothetical protein
MVVIRIHAEREETPGQYRTSPLKNNTEGRMSRQPTRQVISSTDPAFLDNLEKEVRDYRGLRTTRYPGTLIIHLIDSDKYWKKQNRRKKKRDDYDDYDA